MKIFHTSPEQKITPLKWGSDLFGHAIFFSPNVYSMGAGKLYVHELETDTLNIIDECDCDFETENLDGWELQAKIAEEAFALGYDGVKSADEQGTCYMIDVRKASEFMKRIGEA